MWINWLNPTVEWYLVITVDVLSQTLTGLPMRSKSTEETAQTFRRMIAKRRPQKIWSDKRTEFMGAFQQLCNSESILTYATEGKTELAFAEQNIQSLKRSFYKHLEHKSTYHCLQKLKSFFFDTKN